MAHVECTSSGQVGTGHDTIKGLSGADTLVGGAGRDRLVANDNKIDTVLGNGGNDTWTRTTKTN
jgi:Ca2+-binding RTX toxin-like protein